MLSHGDEVERTQYGNNNAYCQDNETSYVSWELDDKQREFLEFVRHVLRLRQSNPVFRRRAYLAGNPVGSKTGTIAATGYSACSFTARRPTKSMNAAGPTAARRSI
jgi:pullulanase/glycogen debranching enzyme